MKPAIERIDLGTEELNQLLERARELLSEEDYRKLKAAVDTLEYLTELVADKDTTIRHLSLTNSSGVSNWNRVRT